MDQNNSFTTDNNASAQTPDATSRVVREPQEQRADQQSSSKAPVSPLDQIANRTDHRSVQFDSISGSDGKGGDFNANTSHITVQYKQKSKKTFVKAFFAGLAGGLTAALIVGGVVFGFNFTHGFVMSDAANKAGGNIEINVTGDENLAQAVAKKSLPSVVSITTQSPTMSTIGSGVVLDSKGNILTNNHVVQGAQLITVTIGNKSFDAELVGADPSTDLAVIKAKDAQNLVPIEVGDSSKLNVGDWVMSIGSPFGLDQSVSTGIVSSLYRNTMLPSVNGMTIYSNLIQTDAAMNPGNSGGALVNDKGQLVGINSIIKSNSGSSAGVGFAIPSNYAMKIANQLISGKKPLHAFIGVHLLTINADIARANNLLVNQGAYIQNVVPGSPAEAAGLQKGDIIVSCDGQEITSADSLILAVRSHDIGDKIEIGYVRDGKDMKTTIELGSDESQQGASDQNKSQLNLEQLFGGR